jgi:ankyrin repeat protein
MDEEELIELINAIDLLPEPDLDKIFDILSRPGVNPNIRHRILNGDTLLGYAIKSTYFSIYHEIHGEINYELVEMLLEYDVDPDIKDNNGETPLIFVCTLLEYDIIELLLEYDADPNLKDNDGNTALILVVNEIRMEDYDITEHIELLLNNGADPTIKNNEGKSAYDIAIEDGMDEYAEDVFLLLKRHYMMYKMQRRRRRNLTYRKKRTQLAYKNLALSKLLNTYDVDDPLTRVMRRETIRSIMDY